VEAVVAAFKLQDFVATCGGAGDTAGVHRRFGTAGAEADHLDRVTLADFFGEFPFLVVGHAEGVALVELFLYGFYDRGVAVSGH